MQTDREREIIFLANTTKGVDQPSPEAAALAASCQAATINCGDCGAPTKAPELDMSTGLCEICNLAAGEYNDYQDGRITEVELATYQAEIGYTGEDKIGGTS